VSEPRLINVLIGAIDLTRPPHRLVAVLGSCIGLAVWDPVSRVAGMAHILLPDSRGHASAGLPGKYADCAVPCLVRALLERGGARERLQAKAAGGARMFQRIAAGPVDVGAQNIAATRAALAAERIPILAEDCGGSRGRKVVFDPATAAFTIDTLDNAAAL